MLVQRWREACSDGSDVEIRESISYVAASPSLCNKKTHRGLLSRCRSTIDEEVAGVVQARQEAEPTRSSEEKLRPDDAGVHRRGLPTAPQATGTAITRCCRRCRDSR